jgi:hypothetical protein
MPSCNVSADLLGRSAANLAVMELDRVHWRNWGNTERIVETFCPAGKRPLIQVSDEEAVVLA